MNVKSIWILIGFAVILLAGCSGNSPTTPDGPEIVTPQALSSQPGRQLWGIWDITIDPDSCEVSITPLRFGKFHANVRQFLEEGPCTNCLKVVPPLVPQPYGIDADISITHPFPGNNYYFGFDVRGIVMLEGTYAPSPDYITTRAAAGDSALLNPDGYTKIFNAVDYTLPGILGYSKGKMVNPLAPAPHNTLNAFRAYYSEGESEDEYGRRGFYPGDTVTRTYELQFKTGEPWHFWYAVDASWEPPTGSEPYSIHDFSDNANCPEAYRFDFSVVAGELFPDYGSVTIGVDIWDHQFITDTAGVQYEAPDCSDEIAVILTPPTNVDGDKGHWEFGITNLDGGLDPDLGAELFVTAFNSTDDPLTGPIHGIGRFTIPVSEDPGTDPEVYSVIPDTTVVDVSIDALEVIGLNFEDGCTVKMEKSGETDIDGTDVVFIDGENITADFDFTGVAEGYWDVTVTNPGGAFGTLFEGFRVKDCNNVIYENYLGTGDFSGGTHMTAYDALFVHDTGTGSDGNFLGYISGYGGTVVTTYIIDTLTPVDGTPLGSGWGNPHIGSWPVPISIDIAEETGRFFIVWDDTHSMVEVWEAADGKLAGETNASSSGIVYCLDTDGSGGFWNGYFPEFGFAPGIKHFTPDGVQPGELVEATADHISLPEVWGTPHEIIIIPDDILLVLTGSQMGKIRAYDISTSPPVYIDDLVGIFSDNLKYDPFPSKPCDMVTDWSEPTLAECRIIVMGNLIDGSTEFVKIDSGLNVLAGPIVTGAKHYHSIDINPNTGDLALWPAQGGSPGEYALMEQPADW